MFSSSGSFVRQCGVEQRPEVAQSRLGAHFIGRRPRQSGPELPQSLLPPLRLGKTSRQSALARQHLDRRRRGLLHVQREPVRATDSAETTATAATSPSCPSTADVPTASATTPNIRDGQAPARHRRGERELRLRSVQIWCPDWPT
jgi:hypothetical protein